MEKLDNKDNKIRQQNLCITTTGNTTQVTVRITMILKILLPEDVLCKNDTSYLVNPG